MSVMLGVIFAHTGTVAFAFIQPQTSSNSLQSWPTAAPILRSGMPWGHEKLTSIASYKIMQEKKNDANTFNRKMHEET